MTTKDKNMQKESIYDDLYGRQISSSGMPKSEFPSSEQNPRLIYAAVHDELMLPETAMVSKS